MIEPVFEKYAKKCFRCREQVYYQSGREFNGCWYCFRCYFFVCDKKEVNKNV